MRDQPTPTPAAEDGQIDHVILLLLLDRDAQRPWVIDEIEREIGEDVADSLARLYGAGLIHRLGDFAWATHAALAADEIGL